MSAKTNLWVDSGIFISFLIAFEPRLTGETIHEWLSLALAFTLIIHIVLHWDWVIKVAAKFFHKLIHVSRLNFLVDAILFVAMILVMLSGLMISRSIISTLGIQLPSSPVWKSLHSWSADASLMLLSIHFALHWKWIVDAFKRYLFSPLWNKFFPLKVQPVQSSNQMEQTSNVKQ